MNIGLFLLTTIGLCVFEVVSSVDNAIINAHVIKTLPEKARRWFLVWGLLIAVFLVRGLLPWLIVWMTMPGLTPIQAFTATFSSDESVIAAIESSAPILLMGGGTFLVLLFFHWIFLEDKSHLFTSEKFIQKHGLWFFSFSSIFLTVLVWLAIQVNPMMAFSAVVGSTAFFITDGFKENAEKQEQELLKGKGNLSAISKILYLEIIDMTFSIDGVLGAFAFTMSVPLILLGNGLGAFVIRELTVKNVDRIGKYLYLKNGAMYSILVLGFVMILESLGVEIPKWFSPVATLSIIGYFFFRSCSCLKEAENKK
jgi:hypothetical protein